MYVFRIHIRPSGGSADMRTTFNYCLKNGLLGVGGEQIPSVIQKAGMNTIKKLHKYTKTFKSASTLING